MVIVEGVYEVEIDGKTALIYRRLPVEHLANSPLAYQGKVWIGKTDEWNVEYANRDVTYLPINSVPPLLEYNTQQYRW